jgi:hypothetical protein
MLYSKIERPNNGLQRTPLRVEQDQADFESWNRSDCFPDLLGRRR